MKVLTLTHYPYLPDGSLKPAGVETFFSWHDSALARAKIPHENAFICSPDQKAQAKRKNLLFATRARFYPSKDPVSLEHLLNIPILRPKIRKMFRDGKFDLCHANGEIYSMYCEKPTITHVHGSLNYASRMFSGKKSPKSIVASALAGKISEIAARRSELLVFNTKMLSEIYPYSEKKVVIQHAVSKIAKSPGKLPKRTMLCSVSRYIPLKRLDTLVSWFAQYSREIDKSAELHMIGYGPLEDSLKALAKKEGAEKKIFFYRLSGPAEVRRAVSKMSALVTFEPAGLGYNGLESMAEGVPVIGVSGDCGCERGAPIKEFSDKESFFSAVESLKHSDRISARKHIEKFHSEKTVIEKYRKIYEQALSRGFR